MKIRRAKWCRDMPWRDGVYQYVDLIRGPNDPKRQKGGRESGDIAPHRTLAKTKREDWAEKIFAHLSDDEPRTFNRIAIEMLDKEANVVSWTPFHEGLWLLVETRRVEYTRRAPVLFRRIVP